MKATHAPVCGYSEDTEILTRAGWMRFAHLTCMDEVATRSPEGQFEWRHPEKVAVTPFEGEMVRLHSRNTDLMVLPGTPILHMKRQRPFKQGLRREEPPIEATSAAASIIGQRQPLVATSRWRPDAPPQGVSFRAPRAFTYGGRLANKGLDFAASAADFSAFMGMYLAEGSLGTPGYTIWIWQKAHGRGFAEYQALLDGLLGRVVPHAAAKGGWHFSNKALFTFLKTCGGYAWTKRVPAEVLDLDARCLEKFWENYALGDGTVMASPGRKPLDVISTTSPHIAGAMQEVLQKLGGWGMLQVVDFAKYDGIAATTRPVYRLVRRAGTVAFASRIERVPYAGRVGSVKVSAPAVYLRRNYRPVWAGATPA